MSRPQGIALFLVVNAWVSYVTAMKNLVVALSFSVTLAVQAVPSRELKAQPQAMFRPNNERVSIKDLDCLRSYREAYQLAAQKKTKLLVTFETDEAPELEEGFFYETTLASFGVFARLRVEQDKSDLELFKRLEHRPGIAVLDFTKDSKGTILQLAPFERIPPGFVEGWLVLGEGRLEQSILEEHLRTVYGAEGIEVEWSRNAEEIAQRSSVSGIQGAVSQMHALGYTGLATQGMGPSLVEALNRLKPGDKEEFWVGQMRRAKKIQWGAQQIGGHWLVVFVNYRPQTR